MKKSLTSLLFLFALAFSACGGADNTVNNSTAVEPEPTAQLPIEPTKSVAICTAQSVEIKDIAQPGDWIKGATEGYAVTITEYGDFQ